MLQRFLAACLSIGLAAASPASAAQPPAVDPEVSAGIRLVDEGRLDDAILILDEVVRKPGSEPERNDELAQAHLWLGVAYAGLSQPGRAKQSFMKALEHDGGLRLDAERVPPEAIDVFEQAKEEAGAATPPSRSARKAVVIGAAGAGAIAAVAIGTGGGGDGGSGGQGATSEPANRPPTASFGVVPEGQAIPGVTQMTFTASGSDPDGDSLSYSWDFGDGARGAGATATHVFDAEGTFDVTLTVSDARGASATSTARVDARALTGTWLLSFDPSEGFEIVQEGHSLAGTFFFQVQSARRRCGLRGQVSDPRRVFWSAEGPECVAFGWSVAFGFEGAADESLTELTGMLTETGRPGAVSETRTYRRQ